MTKLLSSKLSRFLSIAVVATFLTGHVCAEVVSADLFVDGDGLITREVASGLEWVDVTATINQSYNSIMAGYGGFVEAGFRVAKLSEVGDLFVEAGIADLTPFGSPTNFLAANSLMGLIGCGAQCSLPWRYTEAFALFDDANNPWASGVARANLFIAVDSASVAFGDGVNQFQFAGACGRDCADAWEGVWLVRDGVTGTVPEPSTFALLLAGFGLLVATFKSQNFKRG